MDLNKTGRLISKKRKALNLTLGQLSEMLGVTPQAVHLWESGQRYPDASSQIMIHKVLGLNPVELITGLEMFDEELKKGISSYMDRIDEKVFVAGNMQDLDGNEEYIDLSDFLVVTADKDGNPSDKWIPFTDYYNVKPPKEKGHERSDTPKMPYDPTKIYLNHGHSILTFSVELLKKMGNPLYFNIRHDRIRGNLLIVFEDKMGENSFDIPEKVYNGKWKGIHVHGGEFGHALCVEMGVRHYLDLLEITPEIDTNNNIVAIPLDEVKRSTANIEYSDFLLPQCAFCFYEGEDGKYYNQRIKSIVGQKFIHIKAGSKSKVLKVMHLIQSKKEYCEVNAIFFVDRDMSFDMEEYKNDDLYVTPCYSIENLYVSEESMGAILENEFGFNIGDNDYHKYKNKFIEYYKGFCDLMIEFNALVLLRKEKELDCDKVCINKIKTKRIIKIDISSGLSLGADYHKVVNDLKQKLDVTDQDIDEAKTRLLNHGNPYDVFRGKNQLDFLVEYTDQLCKHKDNLFEKKPTSVNINPNQNTLSTLSSYAKTPPDLTDFIKKHCLVESAAIPC